MFLRPAVVRNTHRTPNRPDRLAHLRLDMFLHTVSAEDVAAAPDGSGILLGVLLDADYTIECFDFSCFLHQPSMFPEFCFPLRLQLAIQLA